MDSPLNALADLQGGVFTAAQGMAHGLTRTDCLRLVRNGKLHQLRRGTYVARGRWEEADLRVRHRSEVAAALLLRGWSHEDSVSRLAGGHESAAFILGLPTGASSADPTATAPALIRLVSADRGRRTYRLGVEVCPAALPDGHTRRSAGVPLTSVARTAVDLMRATPWPRTVLLADSALRLGCTQAELLVVAAACAGWRGGLQAVRAARFADPRAASPAESLARAVCADLSLPTPELQVDLFDARGFVGRVDLLFRAQRTVLEIDGKIKYTDPFGAPEETLWREKLREDRLRDAGWEVVRVTWRQLLTAPEEVKARILAAFARSLRQAG